MLYEFALTPGVFDPETLGCDRTKQVIVIQLLRGLLRNGLLANLHRGQWHQEVVKQLQALPQALKDKVIACLVDLDSRNRIVRSPKGRSAPSCEQDWLDLAVEEHHRFGLQGIVRPDKLPARDQSADAPIIALAEVLDSPRWLELAEKQTPAVPSTDEAFRRLLGSLIRYAKRLVLIDRYLTPHENKFFRTVKVCMEVLRRHPRGFRPIPIHVHAGDPENKWKDHHPENVEARLRAWERALIGFVTRDWPYQFEVSLWQDPYDRREDELPSGQRFHDRYILTDQCAVAVHGGLDCANDQEDLTTWSLLDEPQRLRISNLVHPQTSPWTLLRHRTIPHD